jgi:hypothetical protein
MEKEKVDGFDKYEVEMWARTLSEAEDIKNDSKKLQAAQNQLVREQEKAANTIQTLKKAHRNARKNLKKVFRKEK